MPFNRPPPKPFTLARMLVIRNTRVEPEVTGGRIGIPAKVTWLELTRPRYILAGAPPPWVLMTGRVPPPVPGTGVLLTTWTQPPGPAPAIGNVPEVLRHGV